MNANEHNQRKGEEFESELSNIFAQAGISFIHHSRDDSHPDNKYNVDFILDDLIGVDAKWSGTPIKRDHIRFKDNHQYGVNEVYRIFYDQLASHKVQRDLYGLTETYFVHKLEYGDEPAQYRVISLSDVDRIYMQGGSKRTIRSEHEYFDRWDNGRKKQNKAITIFPEDTYSLEEFINIIKGGM